MDHLHSMLDGDLDNFIASEISTDRGVLSALANDVGFVGLCVRMSALKITPMPLSTVI